MEFVKKLVKPDDTAPQSIIFCFIKFIKAERLKFVLIKLKILIRLVGFFLGDLCRKSVLVAKFTG